MEDRCAIYNQTQARLIAAFREHPLGDSSPRSIRIFWGRSFDPLLMVRVDLLDDGAARMTRKLGNPYSLSAVWELPEKVLSKSATSACLAELDACGFWNLPTLGSLVMNAPSHCFIEPRILSAGAEQRDSLAVRKSMSLVYRSW